MFRDPTAQLGVSLVTGQRAVPHLRTNRLTLGQDLLAERAHLRRSIGAETLVATRAEAGPSTHTPAGASACSEARTGARTESGTSTDPEAEATGHPQMGEAPGGELPHKLPALDATRLDTREAIDTRERSRPEPALGEGWRGSEQNCGENQELDGAHRHLPRNVGTGSSRWSMDAAECLLLRRDVLWG